MPTAVRRPLKPITPGQLRALHAIGRRRGMTHEDLREAGGVGSLKDLSVVEAFRLIQRLQLDDHRQPRQPPPPDRAKARYVIRPGTDRQRNYIAALFDQLGWDDDKAAGWLRRRHAIRDLAGGVFSSAAATAAIVQLEHALRKDKRKRGTAAARGGIERE